MNIDWGNQTVYGTGAQGAEDISKAESILKAGAKHLADRAATRDQENGERTMGQIVAAFNAIYGTDLTEVMGWQFMVLLKMARSANGRVNPDDYEDGAAYFALAGEAALRDRSKEDEDQQ